MDYKTLIKLCQKYNIDYKNYYGRTKSYIKLKRKVENYENVKRNQKINNYLSIVLFGNDELESSIKYRLFYIGD